MLNLKRIFDSLDVSSLKIGESLHAKDLVLPDGVEYVEDPDEVIVVVAAPMGEEEEKEEGEGSAAEPEVIKQKKPEEA